MTEDMSPAGMDISWEFPPPHMVVWNCSNDHAMKVTIVFSKSYMGKTLRKADEYIRLVGSFCAGGSL
jgi:hypothetical protein